MQIPVDFLQRQPSNDHHPLAGIRDQLDRADAAILTVLNELSAFGSNPVGHRADKSVKSASVELSKLLSSVGYFDLFRKVQSLLAVQKSVRGHHY